MCKRNAQEFIYELSVWERLIKQLVRYPAWDPEDMGRALAMWAYYYCHDKAHWNLDHERYVRALDELSPGTGRYFTEYVRGDDWARWDASWCGMLVEHQLRHLQGINRILNMVHRDNRPMATPRDLMQLFTGVCQLFTDIKTLDVKALGVENLDRYTKEFMSRNYVTHPEADWMWQ
jgi:hypothetical protein